MTSVIARVHPVNLMKCRLSRQPPPQTKLIDLGCESAEIGINVKKNVDEKN